MLTILPRYGDNIVKFSQYGEEYCQYIVTILWQKMRRLVMKLFIVDSFTTFHTVKVNDRDVPKYNIYYGCTDVL